MVTVLAQPPIYGWMQQMEEWAFALTQFLISYSYFYLLVCPVSLPLSVWKDTGGLLWHCFTHQLQGCHYWTQSSTREEITNRAELFQTEGGTYQLCFFPPVPVLFHQQIAYRLNKVLQNKNEMLFSLSVWCACMAKVDPPEPCSAWHSGR